jgi:uncharacterized protein YecA (UPF0149 family)
MQNGMMTPPQNTHRFVDMLCSRISPGARPARVPVEPDPLARINDCFLNVRQKLSRDGGSIQHGWCIWELPGLFIEAEFHGVWVTPLERMVDITPKEETEILFLVDHTAVFDEASFSRRDNFRLAIKDHPVVHEFIRIAEERIRFWEAGTLATDPRMVHVDREKDEEFLKRKIELEQRMLNLPMGRNDMCRCGSAEKFKRCCAIKRTW